VQKIHHCQREAKTQNHGRLVAFAEQAFLLDFGCHAFVVFEEQSCQRFTMS
jgi:hypothetical protein